MGRFHGTKAHFSVQAAFLFVALSGIPTISSAQSGGFSGIQPVSVYDPLFGPSTQFPLGQHWIHTTKVDYAWTLVGYDHVNPPPVDFNNPNTTIAIIDSGIDINHFEFDDGPGGSKIHPDSTSRFQYPSGGGVLFCPCHIDVLPESAPPEDTYPLLDAAPHGTILSGVATSYVNGGGMAGICWECDVLAVRVFAVATIGICGENPPPRTECIPTNQSITRAIRHAAGWNGTGYNPQPRARIISLSLNGPDFTYIDCDGNDLQDAVNEAYAQGCVVIIAAGNTNSSNACSEDGETCETVGSFQEGSISDGIAIMPNTITVGGTFVSGHTWHCWSKINPPLSNFDDCCPAPDGTDWCDLYYPQPWPVGAEVDRLPVLSVVAPMEDMFSTWADGVEGESNEDFDTFVDGTSIVPPQIAGIVALMLKADPELTFEEVKHILEVTATDITCAPATVGYDKYTGFGLVNARAAVEYVLKQGLPADWNGDGDIGPIDPVMYVADYAAGDPMTDLDLDTTQTTDDMTIFIDSYTNGGN